MLSFYLPPLPLQYAFKYKRTLTVEHPLRRKEFGTSINILPVIKQPEALDPTFLFCIVLHPSIQGLCIFFFWAICSKSKIASKHKPKPPPTLGRSKASNIFLHHVKSILEIPSALLPLPIPNKQVPSCLGNYGLTRHSLLRNKCKGSVDLWVVVGRVYWRRLALDLNHLLSKAVHLSSVIHILHAPPSFIQGGLWHGYLMSPARDTLREEGGINIPFDAGGSCEYIPQLGLSMNCGSVTGH
ncbi:hypothetical protein CDAR_508021 [Caerostris darwini]|uniref:Cytochrome c biogenesis B n=1 Tax=Caerostris darwini TaxID=1538125 RepID=A0AAV4URR5_9ARAC|nr:hypothetical protein CDAR_508021 [Caerostris darwini]